MNYTVNNELRSTILFDGTAESILADILQVMESRTFPRRESESIVGGPKRLQKLVGEEKIRMSCKSNGRRYYNASDVLRHALTRSRTPRKVKKQKAA